MRKNAFRTAAILGAGSALALGIAGLSTGATAAHTSGNNTASKAKVTGVTPALPGDLFAVVNSSGSLARGRGVAFSGVADSFGYEVIFNRNVTRCAYVATVGIAGSSGVATPGYATVAGRSGNPNGVYVQTINSAGSVSFLPFHLHVVC